MTASNRSSELSISPVNGVAYDLPSGADDQARLKEFLSGNPDKPVVVVQGLGFVGAVMSIVCANAKLYLVSLSFGSILKEFL